MSEQATKKILDISADGHWTSNHIMFSKKCYTSENRNDEHHCLECKLQLGSTSGQEQICAPLLKRKKAKGTENGEKVSSQSKTSAHIGQLMFSKCRPKCRPKCRKRLSFRVNKSVMIVGCLCECKPSNGEYNILKFQIKSKLRTSKFQVKNSFWITSHFKWKFVLISNV